MRAPCSLLPLLAALGACAAEPVAPAVVSAPAGRFEPAPTPFVPYRRASAGGTLEAPPPPKMPLGTGAVPVGGGAVRGSVTAGVRRSF